MNNPGWKAAKAWFKWRNNSITISRLLFWNSLMKNYGLLSTFALPPLIQPILMLFGWHKLKMKAHSVPFSDTFSLFFCVVLCFNRFFHQFGGSTTRRKRELFSITCWLAASAPLLLDFISFLLFSLTSHKQQHKSENEHGRRERSLVERHKNLLY